MKILYILKKKWEIIKKSKNIMKNNKIMRKKYWLLSMAEDYKEF